MKKVPELLINKKKYDLRHDFPHADYNCADLFELRVEPGDMIIEALGPVSLAAIPMVVCPKCDTAHMAPGFQHFVESSIARDLLMSPKQLRGRVWRFLRIFFGKTLQEVGQILGSDKSFTSKYERDQKMPEEKQIILKSWYRGMLGMNSQEQAKITQEHINRHIAASKKPVPTDDAIIDEKISRPVTSTEVQNWIHKTIHAGKGSVRATRI